MPYKPPAYDEEGGGDFEPLDPGEYVSVVEALELRYSGENAKNPGSAYVNWTFTVAEGEAENRRLWNVTSLLPQAINMDGGWYQSIAATGLDPEDYSDVEWEDEEDMVEDVAGDVCGRMVNLLVSNRKFEGKVRNDVIAITAYDGAQLGGKKKSRAKTASKEEEAEAKPAKKRGGRKSDMDF